MHRNAYLFSPQKMEFPDFTEFLSSQNNLKSPIWPVSTQLKVVWVFPLAKPHETLILPYFSGMLKIISTITSTAYLHIKKGPFTGLDTIVCEWFREQWELIIFCINLTAFYSKWLEISWALAGPVGSNPTRSAKKEGILSYDKIPSFLGCAPRCGVPPDLISFADGAINL